jgi:hypothetical protein
MKLQIIVLLASFFICFNTIAQREFGIKLNGGVSYLSLSNPSDKIDYKAFVRPSGQTGIFFNYHFKNKLLFGWELLYIQLEGKESYMENEPIFKKSSTWPMDKWTAWSHTSSLGIPVYLGYSYKRFGLNLGFQTIISIIELRRDKIQMPDNNVYYFGSKENNYTVFPYYFLGGRVGLIYNLTDKYFIEANYFYGYENYYLDNLIYGWNYKGHLLTIGIRYLLKSKQ